MRLISREFVRNKINIRYLNICIGIFIAVSEGHFFVKKEKKTSPTVPRY